MAVVVLWQRKRAFCYFKVCKTPILNTFREIINSNNYFSFLLFVIGSATMGIKCPSNSLTQVELAERSGVGIRFVRELERGKATVQLDKVNQVLNLFGEELLPAKVMQLIE